MDIFCGRCFRWHRAAALCLAVSLVAGMFLEGQPIDRRQPDTGAEYPAVPVPGLVLNAPIFSATSNSRG